MRKQTSCYTRPMLEVNIRYHQIMLEVPKTDPTKQFWKFYGIILPSSNIGKMTENKLSSYSDSSVTFHLKIVKE